MFQFLDPVQVPLDSIPSQFVGCTTQHGVACKLAEGTLNPTVQVTDKDATCDIKPFLMQTLKAHHSNHWSLPGYRAIDYNFLGAATQTISYPEWSNHQIHVS